MGVIYKITSPTNKLYIGKTNNLRKRINCHKCSAKKGANLILHNSIRKYGWDLHKIEILEEIPNEQLNEREIFWISELNTFFVNNLDGMNMTRGGDGNKGSWMHNIELRKWYSERFTGDGNPFYGKKHSEEAKKIMSKAATERNLKNGTRIPEWGAEKGRKKVMKPTVVYNNNGEFVGEFESIAIVSKELNLKLGSVKDSVLYGSWISGEYLVKYKTDNYPLKIDTGSINLKNCKRPVLWIKDGVEIEFPSADEASISTGIPKSSIWRASRNTKLKPLNTGHIFIYKDLFINNPTAVGVF